MKKVSLIGLLASLGTVAIFCYAIFGLFCLQNYEMVFWKALFMLLCLCIDSVLLIIFPSIIKTLTLPFALAEITSAAIYTVAQTVIFGFFFTAESVKIYVLLSLIFLLIFAIICAVLYKAGSVAGAEK